MSQYFFQINFILMLFTISHVSYGIRPTETVIFHKRKCGSFLKDCSCDYLQKTYIIECQKMNDLSNFSRIHESGDIFDVNNTFGITFSDIKHLPAGTLWGLKVHYLHLDGQEVTVDEDVFKGMRFLRSFQVEKSSIKVIPDFRVVADSIEKIKIDSSRLTSLEGKNLQNLTSVWNLSFCNNSIRFINPDVFKGTEKVRYLCLARNLLTSIPPKLLDPMKSLFEIDISHNNLQHVDNLFSTARPRRIDLGFNNITDTDSILHSKTVKEISLTLSGNPIKKLGDDGFLRRMPNVKELYLDHCRLEEFDAEQFLSIDHLEVLDLSFNLIEGLHRLSPSLSQEELSVEKLYLSGNKLQSLSNNLRIRNIVEMRFDRNEIKYLSGKDFENLKRIENLQLEGNKIQRIDTNTFQLSKEDLQFLDLSSNLIQWLNGSIRYLSDLRILNLTNNLIQSFARDEFMGLDKLTDLHLTHNHVKALGQLHNLPALIRLFISHNDIELIRPDQIPETLTVLHLAGNPLKCDCSLQQLILRFRERKIHSPDIDFCLQSNLKNSLQEKSYCSGLCSCSCTYIGEVSFMSVDCSSKNLSILPEFLRNNSIKMEGLSLMDQYIYHSLYFQDRVLGINLENNNLESLEALELHPNLIQLYLANNKLKRLPEFIFDNMENLQQVSLSGNPWECDCNAIKFKKWLTFNYAIIKDFNGIRCGTSDQGKSALSGKLIWTLADLDICPINVGLIVSATIGGLIFFILCTAAKILYSKNKFNVNAFLYSCGFNFVKEKDMDYDKKFDAFLSFSHEDGEFVVEQFIREIESKCPNVRLCIHYKDFKSGEYVIDNIMYAVENSKGTVFILSENFLNSQWCLLEFQVAYTQAFTDKVHRIIVIKLGNLPKEIDPRIQAYLKGTTCLTWGERYFWEKLLYIFPTSRRRNPFSSNPENIEMV